MQKKADQAVHSLAHGRSKSQGTKHERALLACKSRRDAGDAVCRALKVDRDGIRHPLKSALHGEASPQERNNPHACLNKRDGDSSYVEPADREVQDRERLRRVKQLLLKYQQDSAFSTLAVQGGRSHW